MKRSLLAFFLLAPFSAFAQCPELVSEFTCTEPGGRTYEISFASTSNDSQVMTYEIAFKNDIPARSTIYAYTDGQSRMVMHGPNRSMTQASTCSENLVQVLETYRFDDGEKSFSTATEFSFRFSPDLKSLDLDRLRSFSSGSEPKLSRDTCLRL
jgi:hypothetical protein